MPPEAKNERAVGDVHQERRSNRPPVPETVGALAEHEVLARQEKLAVLGQLAAGLAHEIRNPLASIRGFCQLLDGVVADEKGRRYLRILLLEVDRMNSLIRDFVELARPRASRITLIDLGDLVRETLILVDSRCFLAGIEIRDLVRTIPALRVDRDKIKQVLLNLYNNAIEAMEQQERRKVLTVSTGVGGQAVWVTVEDTGPGIPESLLNQIGRPFFSTKEAGTGLGLSICHRIVAEHGGNITIQSREHLGTRVTVAFPLTPG